MTARDPATNCRKEKMSKANKHPSPIVVVPINLPAETRAVLEKSGYVVVPVENPASVRIILSDTTVNGNDLLMAAMHGLVCEGYGRMEAFAKELYKRMLARESAKQPKQSP
jgi:hypothetical protein